MVRYHANWLGNLRMPIHELKDNSNRKRIMGLFRSVIPIILPKKISDNGFWNIPLIQVTTPQIL
jgi:hypothetical protein